MSSVGIVLVHGGLHAGDCWDPTVHELRRQAPGLRVLAPDLPGRGSVPGDLANLTIEDCVRAVVDQIDAARLDKVVLVGHSLAGITVPGVAEALGSRVVRRVFLACCVPPQGSSVIDTLSGPLRFVASRRIKVGGIAKPIPRTLARWAFCNEMSPSQAAMVLGRLYPDSASVLTQKASRAPSSVPTTWVLTTRDRALAPRKQRRFIENLGGAVEVVELRSCHDAMIAEPAALSRILLDAAGVRPV
ncbi:MAG TPA: alpha/beta hydrolase [Marmoricola sp.]|nr:alpha/beta hydrolase [Marmoricola sp.]